MKAAAAVVEVADSDFVIGDVELDTPRPDELVVEIVAVGLCHTDLSVRNRTTPFPLPAVLGHEGAGIVVATGRGVTDVSIGQRVLISFASCGTCRACRSGRPVYCSEWIALNLLGGSRLDGSTTLRAGSSGIHGSFFGQSSFATHALVRARSVVPVPDGPALEPLAPLGCSVQTGVGAVLNVARPQPGTTIAVFGAGAVGLAAIMGTALTPAAQVIAVDVNAQRLRLATEFGATHTINPSEIDAVEQIRSLTGGTGAECSIETSGRVSVLKDATRALASAGTCVVIGAPPKGSTIDVDIPELLGRGLILRGTNQGDSNPQVFLPQLLRLHTEGRLPFDRLIDFYPFAKINEAAQDASTGVSIKPVLLMSADPNAGHSNEGAVS